MQQNIKTYKEFSEHMILLYKLTEEGNQNYLRIQKKIKIFKELNLSLLGNPLVSLLNRQITMNYHFVQHISNCRLYLNSLGDNLYNNTPEMTEQILSLHERTQELKVRSEKIYDEYFNYLKEEFNIRKIADASQSVLKICS